MYGSLERRVMQAIQERLETMTAADGYWARPSKITRSLLSIDAYTAELAQGPVIGITRASGSTIQMVSSPDVYEHQLAVGIEAYVKGDHETVTGGLIASDKAADLRDDVLRFLRGDDTLGGLVLDLRPWPGRPVETDESTLEPRAWFRQIWRAVAHEQVVARDA